MLLQCGVVAELVLAAGKLTCDLAIVVRRFCMFNKILPSFKAPSTFLQRSKQKSGGSELQHWHTRCFDTLKLQRCNTGSLNVRHACSSGNSREDTRTR